MSLYIGRNSSGDVEVRNYRDGARIPAGFRTPSELVRIAETLERTKFDAPDVVQELFGFLGRRRP